MRTIYQAGPLFSEAEQTFHRALSARLREAGHTVIWPGDLLTEAQIEAAGPHAPKLIFTTCHNAIDRCSCMVALLDGPQVDDGTAWEIGYAYARGIPVYGLRTDGRRAGETPHSRVNSMIQGCLAGFARSAGELVRMLA
ncbi:MAG: nucleoside 2-deoxyribosyltransferase [Deltaproteobacteria bacterium]|jgi:nucleoside 2-deoxyribosyltransferase|nr:nucleoside 2-deoxyribosyltransferase [Deltaproteobacteria bacterium]